ncbi:MAG: imidazoleglycerol-phosphate dehydratase [Candidatus Eisenbacteria bacterium]|uniref:Imidazoleglycerol-phosphate dehydratase n=1 Tax=Eiseniibacteriota bacterium TaxID=2212470 RepID=A0A956SI76_UNCEI|nr:imidazoleglycerol-phosphate dehydratase [Candidatus Eisenbacteria bacterium]
MIEVRRKTKETQVIVRIGLRVRDGVGWEKTTRGEPKGKLGVKPRGKPQGSPQASPRVEVETEDPFLTHMLEVFGFYAGVDLEVSAVGDLAHHRIEDVALTLGRALAEVRPAACARYGEASVPMDDAWAHVALDIGGRPFYESDLPYSIYDHFLRSLALEMGATLHVRVLRGKDRHHVIEATIKALGRALRQALARDGDVFSTKGKVEWTVEEL